MSQRPPQRALARARLLAELEQSLARARGDARALADDPLCILEVGLLIAQLDRIAAEVERMRLGRTSAAMDQSAAGEPRHWRSPPDDRIAE